MKTYRVKQKLRIGSEKFDIKNDAGELEYQVNASFLQVPKRFNILDKEGHLVSEIVKNPLSFFPKFKIHFANGEEIVLRKRLTFWKDKYIFEGLPFRVEGNIWDLNFYLFNNRNEMIAEIKKEIFRLTSTYLVTVHHENYSDLVISLVVAIDYVEMLEKKG